MTAAAPVVDRPVLTFVEDGHIYQIGDRVVPSVTQIIGAAFGDLVWPFRSEFALERGRLVHDAMHLWCMNDLDIRRLSPFIAGYVAAGVRFLAESGFEVQESERRVYSDVHDFAGTLDIKGIFSRRSAIVDWKSGNPGYAAGPQTMAYAVAWQEESGEVIRDRYAVQLNEDGTYELKKYADNKNDLADFLAARRVMARRAALGASS